MTKKEKELIYGKYLTGQGAIFNSAPTNEEESKQFANALAASGNYPVDPGECMTVGIAGGCGKNCFVYQKGECPEPDEII